MGDLASQAIQRTIQKLIIVVIALIAGARLPTESPKAAASSWLRCS